MLSISKVICFAILYQFHLKQPKTEFLDLFVKKKNTSIYLRGDSRPKILGRHFEAQISVVWLVV
jgi:hypothetical protein